jgi:RNA polymerase sigma factor (TIGR02999 family)
MSTDQSITQLLLKSSSGDKAALDALLPVVYGELRRLAESYVQRERPDHTLQATALVHEAYMRLVDQRSVDWKNRAQFFAMAAKMMRRILVNHAEAHSAAKRGGGAQKLSLDDAISFFAEQQLDLLELNEALDRLSTLDERQARIIELRFFGGLTVDEVADVLEVSPATVKREWDMAKTWLLRELSKTE